MTTSEQQQQPKTKEEAQKLLDKLLVDSPGFNVSFKDIYNSLPKHFFERSLSKGLKFLAEDLGVIVLCILLQLYAVDYVMSFLASQSLILRLAVRVVLTLAIVWWQGVTMTGVWVLAHECGHGAFSPYTWVNDSLGWLLHSLLMVPYFGWQRSHAKHHRWTGHLEYEEVWIPKNVIRDANKALDPKFMQNLGFNGEHLPFKETLWGILYDSSLGYIPKLFTLVLKGTSKIMSRYTNTVQVPPPTAAEAAAAAAAAAAKASQEPVAEPAPEAPVLESTAAANEAAAPPLDDLLKGVRTTAIQHQETESGVKLRKVPPMYQIPGWKSALDGAGIFAWLTTMLFMTIYYGPYTMGCVWWLPLIVTLFFLTSITYLQHTDERLAFWDDNEWEWFRAAILNTMDRSMGSWHDRKMHHITTSHVVHHVFSRMPFYHAEEATPIVKKILGPYYFHSESTSIFGYLSELWNNYGYCRAMVRVLKRKGVWWYTRRNKPAMAAGQFLAMNE